MNTRIVYVFTIRHTGTWFVIKFLTDHPEVSGFLQVHKLGNMDSLRGAEVHHGPGGPEMGVVVGKFVPGEVNVIHDHLFKNERLGHQIALAVSCPTVIPLRDPLACLITASTGATVPSEDLVWDWKLLVDIMKTLSGSSPIMFLPLDLLTDEASRCAHLEKVLSHVGVKCYGHARKWGSDWPTNINTTGDSVLKQKYRLGDSDYVKQQIPKCWSLLRSHESDLRPFLEERGYKNLMWWS